MECDAKEESEKKIRCFFSAHIFLRRPHDLNAWNRLDCCGRGTQLPGEGGGGTRRKIG